MGFPEFDAGGGFTYSNCFCLGFLDITNYVINLFLSFNWNCSNSKYRNQLYNVLPAIPTHVQFLSPLFDVLWISYNNIDSRCLSVIVFWYLRIYYTDFLCVTSTENFKPHQMQSSCLNDNERDICTFLNCCEQSSNTYYHTNRLLETKRVWNIMNINMLRICFWNAIIFI